MATRDARQIYADLARYFGLRERDAFHSAISATPASGKVPPRSNKEQFFGEIFGDGVLFKSDADIFKLLKDSKMTKDVCVTSTRDDVPRDVKNLASAKDQGWGKPADGEEYDINDTGTGQLPGDVSVYQVFPAARGVDISDTEIITLFLSNLSSIEMTRAVPYIDIVISTASSTDTSGNFTKDAHFSLGRFLGAGDNEIALRGKFTGDIGKSAAQTSDTEANLQPVASMEVFTTPQTLIDATNGVSYDENKGGRIDAFRPFLELGNLEITVAPSSFGTIANKSAKLNLKLYDRGRLGDIAPLVSPQRKGNVQFFITYGWHHPDGTTVQRRSSAAGTSLMGDLINAMKLSEAFIVTNSSFSFGADGVVSIDVDLAMIGTDDASNTNILDVTAGKDGNISSVINLMNGIQKKIVNLQKVLPSGDIPQVILGTGPSNILDLSTKNRTKLRKAAANLKKRGGNLAEISKDLYAVIGKTGNRNTKLGRAKASVNAEIQKLIDGIKQTPDPFLSPSKAGIKDTDLQKHVRKAQLSKRSRAKQKYVSFGKLMTFFLTKLSTADTDLQIVFTPFNYSAGAMYDHNISQFPIELEDLKKFLQSEAKKRQKISIMGLLGFVEKYFLSSQGYDAYGLGKVYTRDKKTGKSKISEKLRKKIKSEGSRISYNNQMHAALDIAYGSKRIRPTFRQPNVTMSIVTKKGTSGKNITRITFNDAVHGQVMPIIDAFNSAAQSGHFVIEELNGDDTRRGAQHSETAAETYKELRSEGLLSKLDQETIDEMVTSFEEGANQAAAAKFRRRLDHTMQFNFTAAQSGKNRLKNLFFKFAPSLIYGTANSGIMTADLSSQQNDALLAIALTNALTGKGGEPTKENVSLPLMVHPTTLRLTTFGCPFFRYSQKFFVDLGTNTSADNFYAVIGVGHSISKGDFKTSIDLIQTDAYGSFINVDDKMTETLVSVELARLNPRA